MLNYQKWKKLNETLGSTTLGLSTPHTLGIRGGQFSDLGSEEAEETTDECGCDDKMGGDHDMEDHDDVMHDDMDVNVHAKKRMDDEEDMEDEDREDEDMEDEDMEDEDMEDEDMEDEDREDEDMEDEDMEDEDMEDEDMEDEDMEDEDMEDEDMEDEDMEDEEPEQLTHKKYLGMDHDMPEKTLNKKGNANMISETEWWKSVSGMIGTAAPNGKIISEAADVEDEEEKAVGKKKDLPSTAKPAVTRFETALPADKLKNITKSKIKGLLNELMTHILTANTTMTKANLRAMFKDVLAEYGANKK